MCPAGQCAAPSFPPGMEIPGIVSLAPLGRISCANKEVSVDASGSDDAAAAAAWPIALEKSIRLEALMTSTVGMPSIDGLASTGVLLLVMKMLMAVFVAKMCGVGCFSNNLIL